MMANLETLYNVFRLCYNSSRPESEDIYMSVREKSQKELVNFFRKHGRAPSFYKKNELSLWYKLVTYAGPGNRCFDQEFSDMIRREFGYGSHKNRLPSPRKDRTKQTEELKKYILEHGQLPRKHTAFHALRVLHDRIISECCGYLFNKEYRAWYLTWKEKKNGHK